MKAPLLVNLAPAASTEVCRWCFEYWGMTHRDSMHVPIFHVLALAWYRTSNSDRPVVVLWSLTNPIDIKPKPE